MSSTPLKMSSALTKEIDLHIKPVTYIHSAKKSVAFSITDTLCIFSWQNPQINSFAASKYFVLCGLWLFCVRLYIFKSVVNGNSFYSCLLLFIFICQYSKLSSGCLEIIAFHIVFYVLSSLWRIMVYDQVQILKALAKLILTTVGKHFERNSEAALGDPNEAPFAQLDCM